MERSTSTLHHRAAVAEAKISWEVLLWCPQPWSALGAQEQGGGEQPGYDCWSSDEHSSPVPCLCPGLKGRAGATHSFPSPPVPPHLAPGWPSLLQAKGIMPQKAGRLAHLLLIACSLCSWWGLFWEFSWKTWLYTVTGVPRNAISTPCAPDRCQCIQAVITLSNLALILEALHSLPPHRQKMLGCEVQGVVIWQISEVCHTHFNTCHISKEMPVTQDWFEATPKDKSALRVLILQTSCASPKERVTSLFLWSKMDLMGAFWKQSS